MIVEADVEYRFKDDYSPAHEEHIKLGISKNATDSQVSGELTLKALKQVEQLMRVSTRKVAVIELMNIHQSLMD